MHTQLIETEDHELVDPITGEIIEIVSDRATAETLPKIGRWILSTDRMVDHLNNPKDNCTCRDCNLGREIRKLQDFALRRTEVLTRQKEGLLLLANQVLDTTGKEKIKYPGIGTFGYYKGRASVNSDDWDKLSGEQQLEIAEGCPSLFKLSAKPVLRDIMKALDTEDPGTIGKLFSVNAAESKFQFRGDK